ncbi:uncharacterized protein V1513DRAFT_444435 [Lipomyces chichibuensis]|uniref:uncharacterized protein n=1 Tax=Lipomyces chichibuensis TaxID=1546026 RepID=UPI00334425A1
MSSPPQGSSPSGEDKKDEANFDPSTEDLLARFSALSAPTHELRQRESSPDALGSIDALTERFTKLFNRVPVSGITKPVTSYAAEEDVDPRIFLGSYATAEPLALEEEHKWKDLVEVDENDFEEALRELSAKEWELSADDLAELHYLESSIVVSTDAENGDSGILGRGYLKAVAEDLDHRASDNNKPVEMTIDEKALDQETNDSQIDAEKRLGSYISETDMSEQANASHDGKELEEKAISYSVPEDKNLENYTEEMGLSKEDTAQFQSEQTDIEQQADRLVKMYTSLPGSGVPDKSLPDEDDEKDEDEEAEELVDMYVRLASDDEEEQKADGSKTPGDNGNVGDDDAEADLLARLQSLKSPQIYCRDFPASKLTDVADLPEVPSVILPSVANNIISGKLQEDAALGCCMCSDDVEYRCLGCERSDEDYLYCSKCFLLSHLSEQAGYDERSHRYKKFSL